MHSSTAVGLKSWRCFRTVFGHRPVTKTSRREGRLSTAEGTAAEGEGSKNESEEDVEEEEEEDDDCAEEDERRQDEILGEDVSLLDNVPVERKKITQRVRRAISKPFLHETSPVSCDGGDTWSTYSDHRPPCTWGQPCATATSDPTPTCPEQTDDRSEGKNLSEATAGDPRPRRRRRSSGRLLDEWSDYAGGGGRWNLLLLPKDDGSGGDRCVQLCRLAIPAASAAAAASAAHRRHPAAASAGAQQQRPVLGPGSGPVDDDYHCRSTSGFFFGEEISSSASKPMEFNQLECSKNLIDFDSDEQEDLARNF